ncbi:uncharacterized protein LOC116258326 [Nymphaea colorata]|uniref:uncharacterized protein LOC116258326 n=1 Tax=Nymphaea colorata TaxID=210225 RepID=UPI00129DA82D|nr:uncharacterized protein LOC116258326 [Nymphaea colorata]
MFKGGCFLKIGLKRNGLIAVNCFPHHLPSKCLLFSTAIFERQPHPHLLNGDLRCNTSISSSSSPLLVLVDYLVNSWGFSLEMAEAVATGLGKLKTIHKPRCVLNYLRESGFEDAHIKRLVAFRPKLLVANVDRTLKPKLKVFQDLGFPGNEIGKIVAANSSLIVRSFAPSVDFLRTLFCGDEDVVRIIRRSRYLLSHDFSREMPRCISVLQKHGVPQRVTSRLIQLNPCYLLHDPIWLEERALKVLQLGIDPSSAVFAHALRVVCSLNESSWNAKIEAFKSFEWTEDNVASAFRSTPCCFSVSEASIRAKLEFFKSQLNYDASFLASHAYLLCFSLEKKLIPRYNFCRAFNSKKISKKDISYKIGFRLTEREFRDRYVLPYENVVPDICEAYLKSVRENN